MNVYSSDEDDAPIRIPKSSIKKRRSVILDSSDEDEEEDELRNNKDNLQQKTRISTISKFILPDGFSSSSDSDATSGRDLPTVSSKLPPALRLTSLASVDESDHSDEVFVIHSSKKEGSDHDAIYPGLRTAIKSPRFNVISRNLVSHCPDNLHAPPRGRTTPEDSDEELECWSLDEVQKCPTRSGDEKDLVHRIDNKQQGTFQNPYTVGDMHSRHFTDYPYKSRPAEVSTATLALVTVERKRKRRDPSMAGAVKVKSNGSGLWYRHGAPQVDIHSIPLPSNWRPRNDLFGGSGVGVGNYQLEQIVEPPPKTRTTKSTTSKTTKSTSSKTTKTTAPKTTKTKTANPKRKYNRKKGGGKGGFKKGTSTKKSSAARSSAPSGGKASTFQPANNDAWLSGYQHRTKSSIATVSRKDTTLNHVGGASITF